MRWMQRTLSPVPAVCPNKLRACRDQDFHGLGILKNELEASTVIDRVVLTSHKASFGFRDGGIPVEAIDVLPI